MKCQDCEELLHPYLDGELDAARRGAVDEHLRSCAACREELKQLQMLRRALQLPELRYGASETLRHHLLSQLKKADARERRPAWPAWGAAIAAGVLAVALFWNFAPHGGAPAQPQLADVDDAMVDSAVDQQQDALKDKHLTDIASADAKTVQSWFSGKLAYTPPVPDLSAQGYTLVGGRLDKVKDEPAAALTYQRGDEVVTVFVCSAQHGDKDLDTDSDDGYQVVYWTKGSLSFWVVSKLDMDHLKTLSTALQHTV
ncbi:MAG TPA: anti-sigma factor [Gammaproteobacteria bacterium]